MGRTQRKTIIVQTILEKDVTDKLMKLIRIAFSLKHLTTDLLLFFTTKISSSVF